MRLLARPFLIAAVVGVVRLGALTIAVGEEFSLAISPQELHSTGYPIEAGQPDRRGLSLCEIIPVLASAHRVVIEHGNGVTVVEDSGLADELGEWFVLGPAPAVLHTPRGEYEEILRIDVHGYLLPSGPMEVWLSWEGAKQLEAEIDRYAQMHDLDIRVVEVPKSLTKIRTILRAGGRPPDLIMVQAEYLPELVGMRALQALDGFAESGLPLVGWEAFARDGRKWAVPFYADVQLAFTNPRLFGVVADSTWKLSDLEQRARRVLDRDVIPMAWNAYSAYWLLPFVLGFGSDSILGDDGGVRVHDEPTALAVGQLLHLMEEGVLVPLERDAMIAGFATNEIGLILSGSYSIPQFLRIGMNFEAHALPICDDTNRRLSSLVDYKGFAIPRRAGNPLLARRLARHLVGVGVQTRFAAAMYKLPSLPAAERMILAAEADAEEFWQAMRLSRETGTAIPAAGSYGVYKDTMWKLLRLMLGGEMGIAAALEAGQRIMDLATAETATNDAREGRVRE